MAGMMAMLDRYLGAAVIGTGVAIVFFSTTASWRQRIVRSSLMALSALPAGIWLYAASTGYRAPISFAENFSWFSRSILEWFFQTQTIRSHLNLYIAALWILIGGLIVLLLFSARTRKFSPFEISLFAYGTVYVLALFGSASIAFFNKLEGRFLLPIYIPLAALLVSAIGNLFQRANQLVQHLLRQMISLVLVSALIITVVGLLRVTLSAVWQSDTGAPGDNAFNTQAWHENSVMNYWLAHPPQGNYLLFSNYPDGIAFYTWHSADNSPARYSGPYSKQEFPVTSYSSELFSSGLAVYLIWIEPNIYSYYYKAEDLSPIAQVKPIFVNQDGGIYLLTPKAQSSP